MEVLGRDESLGADRRRCGPGSSDLTRRDLLIARERGLFFATESGNRQQAQR